MMGKRPTALTLAGCLLLSVGSTTLAASTAGESTVAKFDKITTTHPAIARKNLDYSIERARLRAKAKPADTTAAQALVDLLLTRSAFHNTFQDLNEAEAQCERLLIPRTRTANTRLLCAKVWTSVHRYEAALRQLELATSEGAGAPLVDQAKATIALALGMAPATRTETSAPTYRELTAQGAAAAASNNVQLAEQHYQQALRAYSDVSPYAVAWVFGQLGDIWADTNPNRAINYYRQALAHVPDFVRVNIELAQLEYATGLETQAKARLLRTADETADPDVLANLFQLSSESASPERIDLVLQRFEALLTSQPLAFADHAAEFFEGAGADPRRAIELRTLLRDSRQASLKRY